MKKKMFGIVVVIVIALMLSAIPVYAGKGQNKTSFELLIQGLPTGAPFKEAGGNTHFRDDPFVILAEMYVHIGDSGAVEDLTKDYLEYDGAITFVSHTKPETFYTVLGIETILIYNDDTVHDETTLRGTLELKAIGDNRGGHGANFVGFGTGEFEGVKIQGTSAPLTAVPGNPNEPFYYLQLTRTGTVMGWPTL